MAARETSSIQECPISDLSYKDQINAFAQIVSSSDRSKQLEGLVRIRKLSSMENKPPLQEVIDSGIVPKLLEIMSSTDPQLQFESAWVILNICSGTTQNVEYVISLGGLDAVMKVFSSNDPKNIEQAAWIIGNIAGDNVHHRDLCLQKKFLEKLVDALLQFAHHKQSLKKNIVWAFSNLVRGKPVPEWGYISMVTPVLVNIISEKQDQETLKSALWALAYISDKYVEEIINLGVRSENFQVISVVLRVLGNISAGDDIHTEALVANPDCLPKLFALVSHEKKTIRKQVCWLLSNIAGGTENQVDKILEHPHYIESIMKVILEDEIEVVNEASWCLSNITAGVSPEKMFSLAQKEIFMSCVSALLEPSKNQKINSLGLTTVQNMIDSAQNDSERNFYVEAFKKEGIVEKIEALLESENDPLSSLAANVLDLIEDGPSERFAEQESDDGDFADQKKKEKIEHAIEEKRNEDEEQDENGEFEKDD